MTLSDSTVMVITLADKRVLLQLYFCSNHRTCSYRKAKWIPSGSYIINNC